MNPQVIPRFCINGKYYRPDEISEKQLRQILEKRLEKAMEAICYKRKSWVTFCVSVFSGCCSKMLFKKPIKVFRIFKACHMADFCYTDVRCRKKSAGFLKTKALNNLGKGFSGVCFDQPWTVSLGKMKSFSQLLKGDRIKMFFHILDKLHTYQISLPGHKRILDALFIILKNFCKKNHKLTVQYIFVIILFLCVFQKHEGQGDRTAPQSGWFHPDWFSVYRSRKAHRQAQKIHVCVEKRGYSGYVYLK